MKTIPLFSNLVLLVMLMSMTWSVRAADIDLQASSDAGILKSTLGSISEGDVIILKRGMTYDVGGTQIAASVTIKSAPGEGAPALLNMAGSSLDLKAGSTVDLIKLSDVEVSGDISAGYLMNLSTTGILNNFILDSVHVHHVRGVLRIKSSDAKTLVSFQIHNSLIDSIGNYGVMVMDNVAALCANVAISNSTFANDYQLIRWRSSAAASIIDITGCTFYNTPDPAGGYLMRFDGDVPTDTIDISNTIFGLSTSKFSSKAVAASAVNSYITTDCLFATSNFIVAPTAYTGADVDLWHNPATGNFNYADASFAGIGNAGAPNWMYAPVLKHSYTFEDGTADDVVGTVNGTLNGTATVADGALILDANGDHVVFDGAALDLNSYSSISMEYYFQGSTTANTGWNWASYFGDADGANNLRTSLGHWNDEIRVVYTGTEILLDGQDVNDGKLHQIVTVLTADSLLYYEDGTLRASKAIGGFTIGSAYALLGHGFWNDATWQGTIKEFNIYEGKLSADEVAEKALAFLGQSDSKLKSITLSEGELFPAFSPAITEYAVAIPEGASTIVATSEGIMNGVEIIGGSVDVSNGPINDTIKVTSLDKTTETKYIIRYVSVSADCYTPTYDAAVRPNIVPDAAVSDLANFGGWGNKSINLDPDYVYCGLTSGKVAGNNGGSIDVVLTGKLKPNTEYMVKAMVYVAGAGQYQIGLWGAKATAIDHATTLNDQWEEVTFTFTTQATLPGDEGMYFNNYGKGGVLGFIDNWELIDMSPLKVGYITYDKVMAAGAVQPDNDPIIQMLKNDPKFVVDVQTVAADAVVDMSSYNLVVVQEGFSSSAAILKPAGALALSKINVPFIYNKTYALRNGKGFATGGGTSSEVAGVAISVDTVAQKNPLFNGISFANNAFDVFKGYAADDGAAGTKAFNYTYGLTISDTSTLIGTATEITDPKHTVFLNDIPAGTTVGDQLTAARMIAIGMNFGAISTDMGSNFTIDGLTFFRNAFYSLGGYEIPTTAFENSSALSALTASVGVMGPTFAPATLTYQLNLPMGTDSVVLTGVSVDPNGKSAPLTVMLSGADTTVSYAAYAPIGMDSTVYTVAIHVASDNEILYLGNGKTAETAHASDEAALSAIIKAGYSVSYMDRQSINVVGFDYSGYKAVIFGSACGSSDLKPFAAAGYPVPCITLKGDGPRGDKWGWVDNTKAEQWKDVKLNTVASDSAALIAGLKMVVADKIHYITQDFNKGDNLMWTDATTTFADFGKITLPGLNLLDSVTTAIPLTAYAGSQTTYPGLYNAWAIPVGSSVRSLQADNSTYARVTTTNRMVVLGINSDAAIFANMTGAGLLIRSLEWVLGAEDLPEVKKVAYVTFAKAMDAGAAPTTYDPIIRLLQADANLDVTVMPLVDTDTANLSAYDVVVVQEAFNSKSAILMPTGALGMANIPVPFVYNKSYAMKDTRGFSGGATGGGTDIQNVFTIDVDPANQANPLFNGITFENNQVQLFVGGADDSGAAGGKALNFAKGVVLSDTTTLLGMETGGDGSVCINDIPAGTTIGSETTKARMITVCMNYGAITKDNGNNINAAGLTLWRNAVYVAAGLPVPTEAAIIPPAKNLDATLSDITLSVGTIEFVAATKVYNITVPFGTNVVNVTATTNDDKATVTGTGAVLTLSGAGTATLEVTAENGISTAIYTVNLTVGPNAVTDVEVETVSVYPTVTAEDFTVESPVGSVVTVYNVTGTVVSSEVTTATLTTVAVAEAGIYMIQVKSAGVTKTIKVVKVN